MAFEPDMKLTQEFVTIMGCKDKEMNAPPFKRFMELCIKAYLVVRPYTSSLIYLIQLMLDTGLPCFRGKAYFTLGRRFFKFVSHIEVTIITLSCFGYIALFNILGQTIEQLKYRLQPQASEKDAATFMIGVVKRSFLNLRTTAYDYIQFKQNQIPY